MPTPTGSNISTLPTNPNTSDHTLLHSPSKTSEIHPDNYNGHDAVFDSTHISLLYILR
jgi:hypothetical protein